MRRYLITFVALLSLSSLGCAGIATGMVADAVSAGGNSYGSDDDPELIQAAAPFGLKTMESLLEKKPEHEGLLQSLVSGYTQYGYAFVQQKAEMMAESQPNASRDELARANRLYRRALGYGMRLLEVKHSGFGKAFEQDPKQAVSVLEKADVPAVYWTGAALALLISNSKEDFATIGRLPQVDALMSRALALDPDWERGTLQSFFVNFDGGRPEAMGGSLTRAKEHFDRALELTGGKDASLFVTWAEVVAAPAQDRKTFDEMLDRALAVDPNEVPESRLVNMIAQQRARWLKGRVADLFIEE